MCSKGKQGVSVAPIAYRVLDISLRIAEAHRNLTVHAGQCRDALGVLDMGGMKMKKTHRMSTVLAVAFVSGFMILSQSGIANAVSGLDKGEPSIDVSHAVDNRAQEVAVETDGDIIGITLPGVRTNEKVIPTAVPEGLFRGEGEPLLSTEISGASVSSYSTKEGAQTLIEIDSTDSPREYRFPLRLPAGAEAAVGSDGSVLIFDVDSEVIGGYRTPWAYDAKGVPVPTAFAVEGGVLVQTVDFNQATEFPVIADPDMGTAWWGVYAQLTKAETKSLSRAVNANGGWVGVAGALCGMIPYAGAPCAGAIALKWQLVYPPITQAASEGKCAVINVPYASVLTTWAINVTKVTCRR